MKKRLQHECFSVKIAKFLKNTNFEEHLQRAVSVFTSYVAWCVHTHESTISVVRTHLQSLT